MNFIIQKSKSHTCIRVTNEKLDTLIASELKTVLVELVEKVEINLLVDLSACQTCDTSGLSALLLGHRLTKQAEGRFILCGLSLPILEVIHLGEFDSFLEITEDRKEAIARFAQY